MSKRTILLLALLFVGGCYAEFEMKATCEAALAIADDAADSLYVFQHANDCANLETRP